MNENKTIWAEMYLQRKNEINGRIVMLYLITTGIGNIAVLDYEQKDLSIKRKIFSDDYDKAEKNFETVCKRMIDGRI